MTVFKPVIKAWNPFASGGRHVRGILVAVALLAAVGCSRSSDLSSADQAAGGSGLDQEAQVAAGPAKASGQTASRAAPQKAQPAASTEPAAAGAQVPQQGTKADAQPSVKAELAKIDRFKAKRSEIASLDQFLANERAILKAAERLLSMELEAELRGQVRRTWLESATELARYQGQGAAELLKPLEQLTDQIVAEKADPKAVAEARMFRLLARFYVERDGSQDDPAVNRSLFEQAKQFATDFPDDPNAPGLVFRIGNNAELDGQYEVAKSAYRFFLQAFPQHPQLGQIEEALRMLELVGKPFSLAGPTLAGGQFDLSQWRGKVVLVDFWATWCGPCVAELPHVVDAYQKFHDQGFEVVGISLDDSKEQLQQFIADRKLPWPQIFYDEEQKRSWNHPLAQQYKISAIPATFLIDRTGKVARLNVRGAALLEAVAAMVGDGQK